MSLLSKRFACYRVFISQTIGLCCAVNVLCVYFACYSCFFLLRRRSGFRKSVTWRQSRPRPRPRAPRQNLIPGDISTQETTTTPGPNSSDSYFSGEDVDEEVMDISMKTSSFAGFSMGNGSNEMLCDPSTFHGHVQHQVHTNKEVSLAGTSMECNNNNVSIMVDSLSYNGISCYRVGSDLSTAAQSSETSEHEQSGSERQLLYLVARGNLEPLHAVMGNTNSNNGNSSKKTNQPTNQNNSVPIPKPRTGRPPSSVNGVALEKEKVEKPKIPPKPALKQPPAKRPLSTYSQSAAQVAMKRTSSPGTHVSKRYSIAPTLPSQEGTVNNIPPSTSMNTAPVNAPPKATTSAVKKVLRHYEICEPPVGPTVPTKPSKERIAVKQSPKLLNNRTLSQEELKELYSFVDTEKLRAQRNMLPPMVKPYKSSAGSSGAEDTMLSDSDSANKVNNKPKPKPIEIPSLLQPIKPLAAKPMPAKRHSLIERSHSFESLTSPCLINTSRELAKSRSFGPADMVKITNTSKGKFSFLKMKALSFGKKKTTNENSPKSTIKSGVTPPDTLKKSLKPTDSCDRPQSPQLSPAMALKQSSLDHGDTIRFKRQAAIRSPKSPRSPRRSPFSSPWDSPSATPKEMRPIPKPPPEPEYETPEGFFHHVSRLLKKMKSNKTESINNTQPKNSNFQEEHIYETAEGAKAHVPLSPATWMKKKLQRSASQATKKSLYVKTVERSIRRTPSMDCLDDRMLRTTHDASSSDEDGDLDGSFLSSWRSCEYFLSQNIYQLWFLF